MYLDLPALNTTAPAPTVGRAYKFFSTGGIVKAVCAEGFQVVDTGIKRSKRPDARTYGTHVVRLEALNKLRDDDSAFQVVLFNSHDGRGSLRIYAGLYRFVCANGMVVGESLVQPVIFRHQRLELDDVIEGVYSVVNEGERVFEHVERMKQTFLPSEHARSYLDKAMALRDPGLGDRFKTGDITRARRAEDVGQSLWLLYQRAQEGLIKGGARGYSADGRRHQTLRPIRSIDRNRELNTRLFDLTTQYLEAA